MPADRTTRDRRQEAILKLLNDRTEPIREQRELVQLLEELGFKVTQSSISRDLRDLGVYRENGQYHLPAEAEVGFGLEEFQKLVQEAVTAGPFQILLTTWPDAAGRVARIIDESGWPEVVGTLPSVNDKVLVLTESLGHQNRLLKRLGHFLA
jgi:transcriptional regulator of arginine metabolism